MRSFRIIHDCQNQKTRFADILIGFHPSYSISNDRHLQRHDWHCVCFKLKDKELRTQCSVQRLFCILDYRTSSAFKGFDCLIKGVDNGFPVRVDSYELHGSLHLRKHASRANWHPRRSLPHLQGSGQRGFPDRTFGDKEIGIAWNT